MVTTLPTKNAKNLAGCGVTQTVYTIVCTIRAAVKILNRFTATKYDGLVMMYPRAVIMKIGMFSRSFR